MKNPVKSRDPAMRGTWPALLRASKQALEIAKATGTPCHVIKDGKIVNLNPNAKRDKSSRK